MFTKAEFTQAMRDAVAERGEDYIYPKNDKYRSALDGSCVYQTRDGVPACLIGVAADKLGIELPDFEDIQSATNFLDGLVDSDVAWAAEKAQAHQDEGASWGASLYIYLATLSLI